MFDPTKPVQTRDGRKARIVATDVRRSNSVDQLMILALITSPDTVYEYEGYRHQDGTYPHVKPHLDLVNIPVKSSTWQNVYEIGAVASMHDSRERAKAARSIGKTCLGLLRRDYIDGILVDIELEKGSIG